MTDSVDVAIGVVDGKVIAKWHSPTALIAFDPKNAYTVGLALSRAALEAHRGTASDNDAEYIFGELAAQKIVVGDAMRARLVMQVATIVKTFIDQGKTPGYIALHCVDEVLKETAR